VSTASVLILVEYTAFIPTLFTPNQDGKNDVLKIYGMDNIQGFSFRIYNREGSLVFRTENASAAMDSGWDGSVQGILQPAGVYHWKIKGTHGNGSRLLLNGKESGSIVLIR
jgi:gliding motility-associated-like protein